MLRNVKEGNYSDTCCLLNQESNSLLKLIVAVIYVVNSVNVKDALNSCSCIHYVYS